MDITVEDIRKWKEELDKGAVDSRVFFSLPDGYIGNGMYRIANSILVNKAGWDQYIKLVNEAVNNENIKKE